MRFVRAGLSQARSPRDRSRSQRGSERHLKFIAAAGFSLALLVECEAPKIVDFRRNKSELGDTGAYPSAILHRGNVCINARKNAAAIFVFLFFYCFFFTSQKLYRRLRECIERPAAMASAIGRLTLRERCR